MLIINTLYGPAGAFGAAAADEAELGGLTPLVVAAGVTIALGFDVVAFPPVPEVFDLLEQATRLSEAHRRTKKERIGANYCRACRLESNFSPFSCPIFGQTLRKLSIIIGNWARVYTKTSFAPKPLPTLPYSHPGFMLYPKV
jgi:hypothetical protein